MKLPSHQHHACVMAVLSPLREELASALQPAPRKQVSVSCWCADWWSQSDFVLNELNVQSVVTAPAHDEMIPLAAKGDYTVKGFAYSGQSRALAHAHCLKSAPMGVVAMLCPHLQKHGV